MTKKSISRRDFIKAAATAAGAGILAACAPAASTPIVQTSVVTVKETELVTVKETEIVQQVVTATPAPTEVPAPAVMDIWWNTDVPDNAALEELANWKNDANDPVYKKYAGIWGGLAYAKFKPFVDAHPGVTLHIATHGWDAGLRTGQLMALAAGVVPDTTYGEAYVNEFVQLGVYSQLSDAAVQLFPPGPLAAATIDGKTYGLAKSSGADVLFVNLDKVTAAGGDPANLPKTWDELLALAQAISQSNRDPKWGNNAWFNYGPCSCDTYGLAMRVLQWHNQIGAPLGSNVGVPSANAPGAVDAWDFNNQLMATSTEDLILKIDATGELGSGAAFNEGVIALKAGWNNDATSVGAANVNATAVQFPIPAGGQPATILIGNDIESALKNGPNPDLAIALIEETVTNPDAQAWLADNAGIWIPALSSLLEQHATYDKLGGYKTDTAKKMVRVTMDTLLNGNAGPLPGWPKNGSRIWTAWNDTYSHIYKGKLGKDDIQKELDTLQTTIEGLIAKNA